MSTPKSLWTVLTYIAAHNNLDAMGQRSLEQILAVGNTPEVALAVFYDGQTRAARYIAGAVGQAPAQEPLRDVDSGDSKALLKTVRWAFEQHPAEHYGLVLWSHGSGWQPEEIEQVARQARGDSKVDSQESTERAALPGSLSLFRSTLAEILAKDTHAERAICFDDGTGHSLDTLELDRLTRGIQQVIGQPLDLLGMDACLMATLEVAYQLRESVDYLVASEELVPGFSWPYDLVYGDLRADPRQLGSALAASVVRRYTQFYTAHPPASGDVTKVALDLSTMDALAHAMDQLAGALCDDMDAQADVLWRAQLACYEHESRQRKREPNKFRYHLWDIDTLASQLAKISTNAAIANAAQAVSAALKPGGPSVLAEGHYGDWFDGIGGVTAYLPPPQRQRISPYYSQLALAKDTRWGEMLNKYHEHYA